MKTFLKNVFLFIIFGSIYALIEIAFRGHTHWTMAILGGLCGILIGSINEYLPWEMSIIKQGLIGAGIVTVLELIFGIILNIILQLGIWDYSHMPCNLWGQICLPFSIAWFFLSFVAIFLDDFLRWKLFGGKKPHYHLRDH
jgi:uncharacterized membrane protein